MGSVTCRLLWSPLFQTFINVNHTDIDREQKMRFWFHRCKKKHWCYHTYQENNYTFMRKEINDSEVNNNYGDILSFFFFLLTVPFSLISLAHLPSIEKVAEKLEGKTMILKERIFSQLFFPLVLFSFSIFYNDNKTIFYSVIPRFPSLTILLTLKWNYSLLLVCQSKWK